ncbi:hypothetical protein WR25_12176 [Diploscapter pachys]|uniref:Uncharacterized protein n=1 Tax=Diploscapter pachys TaxID=2018661 RepID=A0A2A2LH70_9BILA|nr:hypothetical protein WR25_12176 [Diploscapter pachys]
MVCSAPVLHSKIDFATEVPVRIGEIGRPFLNAPSRVELEKRFENANASMEKVVRERARSDFSAINIVCLYCGLPSTECEGPAQDQLPCPVVECPTWRKRKCEGDKSIGCTGPGDEIKFCQIAACPYYSEWRCITDEFLNLPTLDEIESTAETDAARLKAKARAKVVRSVMSSNGTVESSSKASGASLSDTSAGVCDGPDTDRKVCDAGPCCSFTEWTEWTSCIGCGQDSVSKRNRQCLPDSTAQFKLPTSLFQSDPPRFRSSSLGSSSGSYSIGPSLASPSAALGIGTLAGLQPIVPVNGRRKRQTFSFGLPPQCHCEGESFESRPCPQQTQISCSEDACQWSEWGKWCGCENCRAGKEIRRRYCDKPGSTAGRQGPFQPNAGCSCRGRDTEERECAVDTNCFNSPIYSKAADSYISPKDELARGSSKTKGEGGGSDGHNEYIPIRSKLGEVQLKGDDEGKGEVWFKEKDSPQAFTTTPFPYQMCHWSNWGHFSPCDNPLGNCECHGKSVQQVKCDINDEAGSEENYLKSTDDNKFANALQEFTSESRESNEQKDNDVLEASSPVKECDYLQWSPWSICTKTCGVGLKIRKRRCPCGDNRCGAGKDTDTEECEVVPCEVTKAHPSFALHESDSDHLD